MPRRARPCRADDDNHRSEQVQMPFPPNARRSDEDEARNANAKKVISGKEGDIGEGARRRSRAARFGGSVVKEHEG